MKFKNLDGLVLTVDGKTIRALDRETDLTYRKGFIAILEFHNSKKPGTGEPLRAFLFAKKLFEEKEPEISNEEFDFINSVLEQSKVFNLAVVTARLLHFLQGVKDTKVEPQASPLKI